MASSTRVKYLQANFKTNFTLPVQTKSAIPSRFCTNFACI